MMFIKHDAIKVQEFSIGIDFLIQILIWRSLAPCARSKKRFGVPWGKLRCPHHFVFEFWYLTGSLQDGEWDRPVE